jgi:RNA ligase
MKFGKLPEQMLNDVPDEFYDWVHATQTKITEDFKQVMHQHMAVCSSILRDGMLTQKEFAERVLAIEDINHGIVFGIANGKDVSERAWKMVKPTYSKPFTNVIDI